MSDVSAAKTFMVFDVESVGLHGEGFAVGYVVVDDAGKNLDSGFYRAHEDSAFGTGESRTWVNDNVVPALRAEDVRAKHSDGLGSRSPARVRKLFWDAWIYWKAQGAILAADCPWPVESRFLAACVDTDPETREWAGPYPLIDVASVRLAAGLNPLETGERKPDELPIHHPLADARQSARLLLEALAITRGRT